METIFINNDLCGKLEKIFNSKSIKKRKFVFYCKYEVTHNVLKKKNCNLKNVMKMQ